MPPKQGCFSIKFFFRLDVKNGQLAGISKWESVLSDSMMEEANSIKKALEKSNLDELFFRLYLYTRKRLSRMVWRGEHKGSIPGGLEAEDFIQAALKKALSKERIWNSSEHSLVEFLTNIISSDINHLAEKTENVIEQRATTLRSDTDRNVICIKDLPGKRADWPDTYSLNDQERYDLEFIQSQVGDNPTDRAVVRSVIQDGLSRSADIAIELGVPVSEVYKSKKRLRRKCQYLRAKDRDSSTGKYGGFDREKWGQENA
jgi:DNA-directed RNA polymerase specialized sigma24 family protein